MKRIITTIILAAIAAVSAFAQISVGGGYLNQNSKVTISTNSSLPNLNLEGTARSSGFYVGGDYTLELANEDLVLMPGIYYTMASYKEDNSTSTDQALYIPVSLGYRAEITDDITIFPFAGPQFNIGLSSIEESKINGGGITTTVDNYANNEYNRFNIAVTAGVGVDIMEMIRVKFAYNWGLLDLNKNEYITHTETNWQIGVAYLF